MARRPDVLSNDEARRIAVASQGFIGSRRERPTSRDLLRILDRLSLYQIDSVSVVTRAHYLPAFSRLGPYDQALLDELAWGKSSKRRLFEYWGHEASLLPLNLYPLMRWRMAQADRGEIGWKSMRAFATQRRPEAEAILKRIGEEGALAASDFADGKGKGGWWAWSDAKQALEWLFWSGHITTSTRRRNFERLYDLTESVIPRAVLDEPVPAEPDAHRLLLGRAAKALGVATARELRDYFRLKPEPSQAAIAQLVEDGVLLPVRVEGWSQATYLHADARCPRKIHTRALLAPFDPLVWERARTERLFGFLYRIEIYTPAPKRVHGYYVLPFLLDGELVARVDLKSDRQNSQLIVRKVTVEPSAPSETVEALRGELSSMAQWLNLDRVHWT
jgi:uncharacterized protein